jgi:2-polyprenyl-6-hydroxyphenyl methylase/3-demethylubiquinone-9 3-methyltransferase
MITAKATPDELSKFKAVATDWWDPRGPMRPLHEMNPVRINYMQQRISIPDKKWLDVGCGGGLLCEPLTKLGANITGIDPCIELIEAAKDHAKTESLSIDYLSQELHEHPLENTYDVISCLELLEHVDKPEDLLRLCHPLLKKNGTLFLSTLHRNWTSFLLGIVAAEYVLGLVPRGTHRYQQFIKPSELQHWLTNAGFILTDISGLSYNPIDHSCTLSNDVRVNYIIEAKVADNK